MKSPPCPKCNGTDTSAPDISRPGPNKFYTLLIGWLYVLPRLAFFPRPWTCRECGEQFRRRTTASYVALVLLILIVLSIIMEAYYAGVAE